MRLRYLALVVTLCSVSPGFAVEARGEGVLRLRDPSLPFFASPCAPTLSTTPGSVQGCARVPSLCLFRADRSCPFSGRRPLSRTSPLFSSISPGIAPNSMDDESEEEYDQQVYVTHMEDAIWCGVSKVEFLRAAFGNHDDVMDRPIARAEPFQADSRLTNEDELRGRIALVQRGSSSGEPCSFVEKAMRVESAGAVAMVVVNTEDSMISPGDSAREGGGVNIPVVGIRAGDLPMLMRAAGEDSEKVSITFKPISPLTTEQRKHLRALASIWLKESVLPELELDEAAASESVLASVDEALSSHELVLLRIAEEDEGAHFVSLQTLEDVFDVATVIADNLGGTVVHFTDRTILLYRAKRAHSDDEDVIRLPGDGERTELELELGELASSISMLDLSID